MRSIRLSLMCYFVALSLLGLGGVAYLAYQATETTLNEKEADGRRLIESEHHARILELQVELDATVLKKAKLLVLRQGRPARVEWLNVLPVLLTPVKPFGHLHLAADLRLGVYPLSGRLTPLSLRFHDALPLEHLVSTGDELSSADPDAPRPFCATYFANGQPWERTSNLAKVHFPLDARFRVESELMQERFDEVKHGNTTLRRVTLKVPRAAAPISPGTPSQSPGLTPVSYPPLKSMVRGPLPPNATQIWRALNEPYFFVQYALDTAPLRQHLAALAAERDARLARLSDVTQSSLESLRRRLAFLCGITAVGVLLGGFILIWIGLMPLRRLTDAVSRINERTFDLQVDPVTLPNELQPIARRLTASLDQLKKAFAREKQAAQDISHDLRTPLAALTTTIEVALKKDRSSAEYRELIEDCQVSARQMSHLVERLLALAKVDAGTNPARPRPVDVVEVANDAADLVRPLARARDIVLTIEAPEALPMLADADKIRESLTNLLHNAIDYNRDGGRVTLGVHRFDGHVEFSVADTGVGIRPEAKDHLFERFYRADAARSGETPHCGLGLAIVKSYVDLMNGTITLESEPGQGATFRIRIPYRTGRPGVPESEAVLA